MTEHTDSVQDVRRQLMKATGPYARTLAQLYLEAGELNLLMGVLRNDIDSVQASVVLAQSEEVRTLLKARVVMAMSLHTAFAEAYESVAPKITCPRCGMTSNNPTDVIEGYCANCSDWTSNPQGVGDA